MESCSIQKKSYGRVLSKMRLRTLYELHAEAHSPASNSVALQ